MWIHLPSTCCPSAPGTAASTSELTLPQAERLASSATLSAKRSLPRYWRLAWRKKSWLRLLSGATCELSTADFGVASWISSLAAIRASRSVTPASALESRMSGIYGQTSLASLARLSPASSSSRMSPDTSLSASMLFAPTSSASATELRLDYSRRLKLAQAIAANACSSSAWPTPNCPSMRDNEDAATRDCGRHQYDLKRAAIQWPTPCTITGGPEAPSKRKERKGIEKGVDLQSATMHWPTLCSNEHKGATSKIRNKSTLKDDAVNWTSSPPAPASEPDGPTSSLTDPTSRQRLNVNFVEWLMGLPAGWTDFAPLGTEWCRWSRRMRSRLSGLVSSMAKENDR